jgi:hypothetical protein
LLGTPAHPDQTSRCRSSLGLSALCRRQNPAPPEDCGGIPGFYAQLEALADPNCPDHDHAKERLGDFDPNRATISLSKTASRVSLTAVDRPQPKANSDDQLTLTEKALDLDWLSLPSSEGFVLGPRWARDHAGDNKAALSTALETAFDPDSNAALAPDQKARDIAAGWLPPGIAPADAAQTGDSDAEPDTAFGTGKGRASVNSPTSPRRRPISLPS